MRMEIIIKVIGKKTREMEMELLNIKMEIFMMVIGKMIKKMEKDQ
jgi:hypothetical protein